MVVRFLGNDKGVCSWGHEHISFSTQCDDLVSFIRFVFFNGFFACELVCVPKDDYFDGFDRKTIDSI